MVEAMQGLKIGVGTKIEDIYSDKEAFEQARLADKNGDHIIDEDELNRYVGPVFAENITTKEGRIEGSVGHRHLSAVLLKDDEVDYYPGLTLDKVKNGRELKTFADIDLDGNQKLSAEEISLYPTRKELDNENKRNNMLLKELESCKTASVIKKGALIGGIIGTAIALLWAGPAIVLGSGAALAATVIVGAAGALLGAGSAAIENTLDKKLLNKDIKTSNTKIKELKLQVEQGSDKILGKTKETK